MHWWIENQKSVYMKPEDLLLDESFLAWYYRSDEQHWSRWEQLRDADPELRRDMDEAVRILQTLMAEQATVGPTQQEIARERLMERIDRWESRQNLQEELRIGSGRYLRWIGAAASVLVFLLAGLWLFSRNEQEEFIAEAGSPQHIVLPDGSSVDLNGNSRLTTRIVKGKDREVWLEGEAYFKITKQSNQAKFIVHSGQLKVEVLGTEFNVRGMGEKTEVVLESGKVQLSLKESSDLKVVMEPGELAEFSKSSGQLTKRDVNTRLYTSWKEGKVIFENATVEDIARILRERYLLQVKVEEGSVLGEFNGIFPADDARVVLTALKKTYPGRIESYENSITIRK